MKWVTIPVLTILIGSVIFVAGTALATSEEPTQVKGKYVGSEACGICHEATYSEWQRTKHRSAYSTPAFQDAWTKEGKSKNCLRCHTTGFDSATGTFAVEGVTCESCHQTGMHPVPGKGVVTMEAILCGQCHTGEERPTINEWSESKHADALNVLRSVNSDKKPECLGCHSGISALAKWSDQPIDPEAPQNPIVCVVCHDPHLDEIRVQPSDRLCGRCHVGEHEMWSEDSPHGLVGIQCATCHRFTRPIDRPTGHAAITGHTFKIIEEDGKPVVCEQCHGVIPAILSYERAVQVFQNIQNRIGKAVETTRAAIYLAQENVEIANSTKGVDQTVMQTATALLNNATQTFKVDVERAYRKGFHNPTGMLEKIDSIMRDVTKAQSMAMEARLSPLASQLAQANSDMNRLREQLDTAEASIGELRRDLLEAQQALSDSRSEFVAVIYVTVGLMGAVAALMAALLVGRRR